MPSFDTVIEQIRAKGERLTIQRRLIVEALAAATGHVSISAIQSWLNAAHPEHDLPDPTVYRILQWLKDLELVSQTDMGSDGIVYELISEPHHHHLICLRCGMIIHLDDQYFAPLREALAADLGFRARIDHMAIYGLCSTCVELEQSSLNPSPAGN